MDIENSLGFWCFVCPRRGLLFFKHNVFFSNMTNSLGFGASRCPRRGFVFLKKDTYFHCPTPKFNKCSALACVPRLRPEFNPPTRLRRRAALRAAVESRMCVHFQGMRFSECPSIINSLGREPVLALLVEPRHANAESSPVNVEPSITSAKPSHASVEPSPVSVEPSPGSVEPKPKVGQLRRP